MIIPTWLNFLAPSQCVGYSQLSMYGLVIGFRGFTSLGLWMSAVPSMLNLIGIRATLTRVQFQDLVWKTYRRCTRCCCSETEEQPLNAQPRATTSIRMNGSLSDGHLSLIDDALGADLLEMPLEQTPSSRGSQASSSTSRSTPISSSLASMVDSLLNEPTEDQMQEIREWEGRLATLHAEVVASQAEADYFLRYSHMHSASQPIMTAVECAGQKVCRPSPRTMIILELFRYVASY